MAAVMRHLLYAPPHIGPAGSAMGNLSSQSGADQHRLHEGSKAWAGCEALGPARAQARVWGVAWKSTTPARSRETTRSSLPCSALPQKQDQTGTQTSAQPRGGVDWQSSPLLTDDIRSLWKIQQIDKRRRKIRLPGTFTTCRWPSHILGPVAPEAGSYRFFKKTERHHILVTCFSHRMCWE